MRWHKMKIRYKDVDIEKEIEVDRMPEPWETWDGKKWDSSGELEYKKNKKIAQIKAEANRLKLAWERAKLAPKWTWGWDTTTTSDVWALIALAEWFGEELSVTRAKEIVSGW